MVDLVRARTAVQADRGRIPVRPTEVAISIDPASGGTRCTNILGVRRCQQSSEIKVWSQVGKNSEKERTASYHSRLGISRMTGIFLRRCSFTPFRRGLSGGLTKRFHFFFLIKVRRTFPDRESNRHRKEEVGGCIDSMFPLF
jgi:hypothetical protein